MATVSADKDVFTFEKFLGLRNRVKEEELDTGDLTEAVNVDLTNEYRLRRRLGFGAAIFSSPAHSLWSDNETAMFVSGTSLYRLNPDYSYDVLRSDLTPDRRMYYVPVADRVYFSNGAQSGVLTPGGVRTWGLARPVAQPTAAIIGGTLPAGSYQFAVTYLRDDGQESGTGVAGVIDLPSGGGIRFDLIPVPSDPTVVSKLLYVSPTNGDMLYAFMELQPGTETATYVMPHRGLMALGTQFLSAPPAGEHLAYFAGRTLVAVGNRLYVSEPFAPELFDFRKVYSFAGRITLVAPVDDGVFLGTEGQVLWLPGKDPAKWEHLRRASYGVIPGTLAYGNAEDLNPEADGPAAFFASATGLCVGLNGGTFRNLTAERFAYPTGEQGAGMVRRARGTVQYVVTIEGSKGPANAAYTVLPVYAGDETYPPYTVAGTHSGPP